MVQSAAVARQMKDAKINQMIVAPSEVHEYMRHLLHPVGRRAYEIFESRGCVHGHDWDDWFQAESELLQPVTVELSDAGEAFLIVTDVRGYRSEDLRVSVEPRSLRICGKSPTTNKKSNELGAGSRRCEGFVLAFDLPASIVTSQVSAGIRHNLLELHLPKVLPQTNTNGGTNI